MNKIFFLIISVFLYVEDIYAQTLLQSIPLYKAQDLNVDRLSNIYITNKDQSVLKLDNEGDSIAIYRANNTGKLSIVDVTNPLKVGIFYQAFSKVTFLDRLMTYISSYDLKSLGFFNVTGFCQSVAGGYWVYDENTAQLSKIDDQQRINYQSNDLRLEVGIAPSPYLLVENERNVYLCDTENGIYVFDQFGKLISNIPFKKKIINQIIGPYILYANQKGDTLFSYHQQSMKEAYVLIPNTSEKYLSYKVISNKLYILYANKLDIFEINNLIQ